MAESKTAPAPARKPFNDAQAFAPSHQRHFGPDSETSKATEFSELANLKEKEAMLVEKGKRIDGMDAGQMARERMDIDQVKNRNARQLQEIRKEIARLSK